MSRSHTIKLSFNYDWVILAILFLGLLASFGVALLLGRTFILLFGSAILVLQVPEPRPAILSKEIT